MITKGTLALVMCVLNCLPFPTVAQQPPGTAHNFQVIDEDFILAAANGGIVEIVNRVWYLKYNGHQIITSFALDTSTNRLVTIETDTLNNAQIYVRSISDDGIQMKELIKTNGVPERLSISGNKIHLIERQDSTWILYEINASQNDLTKIGSYTSVVKQVISNKKDNGYFFSTKNSIYKKSMKELIEVVRSDDEILHFESDADKLYISTATKFYVFVNGSLSSTLISVKGSFAVADSDLWHLDPKGTLQKQTIKY